MSYQIDKYVRTVDWFLGSALKQRAMDFLNQKEKNTILEIGSYEGLSACYFSDLFLEHPESRLICVDPFDVSDITTPLTTKTEIYCRENINKSHGKEKVTICKTYSDDYFKNNQLHFNFVYIDGSHVPSQITRDMENCWKYLDKGGIMWMDDYLGGTGGHIKAAMDGFLRNHTNEFTIVYNAYQLALKKLI